jgi:hypothetical protein
MAQRLDGRISSSLLVIPSSSPPSYSDLLTDLFLCPPLGAIRIHPVLAHYRQFSPPVVTDESRRFAKWLKAITEHSAVKATTSTEQLYIDR